MKVGVASLGLAAAISLSACAQGPVPFRLPQHNTLRTITVNGKAMQASGPHNDTVVIATGDQKHFEVVAQFS